MQGKKLADIIDSFNQRFILFPHATCTLNYSAISRATN